MTSKGSASFIAILMRIDRRFILFSSSNWIFHSLEVTRSQTVVRLILFRILPSCSKLLSNIDTPWYTFLKYYPQSFSRFSKVSRSHSVCQLCMRMPTGRIWCARGHSSLVFHPSPPKELSRQVETKIISPWPNTSKIVFIPIRIG